MTIHLSHRGDYSKVAICDYDTEEDKIIVIPGGIHELSLSEARELVADLLACCQLAESHFRKERGYTESEVLSAEQRNALPAICVHEPSPGVFVQVRIVSAANVWGEVSTRDILQEGRGMKPVEKLVIPSARHGSNLQHLIGDEIKRLRKLAGEPEIKFPHGEGQGFIDQWDRYWNREDAFIIAKHAGQINASRPDVVIINDELYSENLY
jgi:hypothetical protein